MREALQVIAGFPDQDAMFAYCEQYGVGFHKMEPPYLTMARIAGSAIKLSDQTMTWKRVAILSVNSLVLGGFASLYMYLVYSLVRILIKH